MKSFKDKNGLTWDIVVNVGTGGMVKDLIDIDLLNLYSFGKDSNQKERELFSNPYMLVNVLYVLCRDQAEARKITDKQFGEALVGDAIEEATQALMLEVADFFPKSRREIMHKMLKKSQAAAEQMEAEAKKDLEALTVDQLIASMKSRAS